MGTWLPLTCAWAAEPQLQTAGPSAPGSGKHCQGRHGKPVQDIRDL